MISTQRSTALNAKALSEREPSVARRWKVGDEADAANGLWTIIDAETAQDAVDEWYRLYNLSKDDDPDLRLVIFEWRDKQAES